MRNPISGKSEALPRLMWADCDPEDHRTPVAVYPTQSEQRSNRPDLEPIPVIVISLTDSLADMTTQVANALSYARERRIKIPATPFPFLIGGGAKQQST